MKDRRSGARDDQAADRKGHRRGCEDLPPEAGARAAEACEGCEGWPEVLIHHFLCCGCERRSRDSAREPSPAEISRKSSP
eukprot:678987-Pyramimonas_sp.AAC.1